MNKHNFNQTGLYPLNTERLQELQTSFAIFNQLGWVIGNFAIIEGCVLAGGVVTNGYVFINGEVYPFIGGNVQTTVRIFKTSTDRAFNNGAVKTVYEAYEVRFSTGADSIDWINFKRPNTLLGLSDLTTAISETLGAAVEKLETIQEGAQVNVQVDYNQNDDTKDDYIKNMPNLTPFLYKGNHDVGNILNAAEENRLDTITFPDIGTSNYLVVGSLVSKGSDYNDDNDVIWSIKDKNTSSFKLLLKEVEKNVQDLEFNYALIPY